MKIGILTYHRAENYGALLQAYAMMTYLRSLGHEVSFVDYWPKYHSDYFKLFSYERFCKRSLMGKLLMVMNTILWIIPQYKRKHRLQKFMYDKFGLSPKPLYTQNSSRTEHFDIVVYGSDQIWRKQNLGGVGFDSWYFGSENVWADKKVVYAGSMGTVKTDDDEFVKQMMHNFSIISVRESDLQTYLYRLGVHSEIVVDPVFLLKPNQWRGLFNKKEGCQKKKKYILFYNLLLTSESTRFTEALSTKTGLPIVEINKQKSFKRLGKRYVSTASVEDFLQLIDEAEYVVSNSFHGVALSLIFQKQFFAVGMGAKANRVVSLLKSVGLEERYVTDRTTRFPSIIDYSIITHALNSLSNSSSCYLNISLNHEKNAII